MDVQANPLAPAAACVVLTGTAAAAGLTIAGALVALALVDNVALALGVWAAGVAVGLILIGLLVAGAAHLWAANTPKEWTP